MGRSQKPSARTPGRCPSPNHGYPWKIADHLCVSNDTVYRWIAYKGMPSATVGSRWKFRVSKVDAWVESGQAADLEVQSDGDEEANHGA